ncbi:hypothetical protein [Blattabacterium cuenoti]|uniref:hypothetical protein n=1 Tax=Blattabacterium cuenoti TaxID=1653831 RepID=UPI00163C1588|nr:hypothetical protein [Blattabacterium cuenoti]
MNYIQRILSYFVYIIYIVFLQLSMLNPIFLGLYSYIYIVFIIQIPVYEKKLIVLLLSFLIGWIIDQYLNTGGMHAFSSTFTAFFRLKILKFFDGNNFIFNKNFSIYKLFFIKKILFIYTLIIVHHGILFILQTIHGIFLNKIFIFKIIFSSIFTLILCMILFFKKNI